MFPLLAILPSVGVLSILGYNIRKKEKLHKKNTLKHPINTTSSIYAYSPYPD